MILVLCLFAITILLDIWRIEKRVGNASSAMAMIVLSITIGAVGLVFAKCAWTGVLPSPRQEACP